MKKSGLILGILLFAACSKAELEGGMVFHATVDESKTVLEGTKVLWSAEDGIVVNGVKSSSTTVNEGSRSADFTFGAALDSPYYALYPSSGFVSGSYVPSGSRYGSITLPSAQNWVEGSFDPKAAVMYGFSSGSPDVNFVLGVAFIRFTIDGGYKDLPVKRIELSSLGDEDMSGKLVLRAGPVLELSDAMHSGGVKLTSDSGIPLGSSAIVAIAPGTYASGIKVRIVDMEGHFQDIRSTKSFSAEAGRIYNTSINFVPTGTIIEGGTGSNQESGDIPDEPSRLKILFIGNSHTVDATDLLPFMLNSAGVRDVEMTRVYHGGYYLVGYNTYYTKADNCSVMTWKSGQMRFRGRLKMENALQDAVEAGPYDIVVMQEFAGSSYAWTWDKENYAERAAVTGLIAKIKAVSPSAKLYYYLSHCYGKGNANLVQYFNDDNDAQFAAIIAENAQHLMDPAEGYGFERMISTAALVQNLRHSQMNVDNGKDMFRGDALHMDYGAVRWAGACLLWRVLLQDRLGINYKDVPFRFREFYPRKDQYTTPVTDGNIDVLYAAVDAAYDHPMEITDLSSVPVNTDYAYPDYAGHPEYLSTLDMTGVDVDPVSFPVDFEIGWPNGEAAIPSSGIAGMQGFWFPHGVWVAKQQQAIAKWVSVSRPDPDLIYNRTYSVGTADNNLSTLKVSGVWTGDYFEFVLPVKNFAAGTTVSLYIPMYVDHAPIFWYFDYLDGGVWKCDHSEKTSYGTDATFTRDCTVALGYKLNSVTVNMTFENAVPEGFLHFRVRCADGSIQAESGTPVQRDKPNVNAAGDAYSSTFCFWSTTRTAVKFSIVN